MTAILAFIAQHWRLTLGLGLAAASYAAIEYWKHEAHVAEAQVMADRVAGAAQDKITQQIIKTHEQLKEAKDVQAKLLASQRDDAVARMRALAAASASQRIVPASTGPASSGGRVCYAADELDRGIRERVARLRARVEGVAAVGQAGVDTATICRDWAKGL